jgi:hypothetical protein
VAHYYSWISFLWAVFRNRPETVERWVTRFLDAAQTARADLVLGLHAQCLVTIALLSTEPDRSQFIASLLRALEGARPLFAFTLGDPPTGTRRGTHPHGARVFPRPALSCARPSRQSMALAAPDRPTADDGASQLGALSLGVLERGAPALKRVMRRRKFRLSPPPSTPVSMDLDSIPSFVFGSCPAPSLIAPDSHDRARVDTSNEDACPYLD